MEYIRDYLRFKGHKDFLESHLNVANQVYLMYDIATCGPDPYEFVNPSDKDIDLYFEKLQLQYSNIIGG